MITHSAAKIHWTYFTAVEQDVETLTRYVEPTAANFDAYSLEMCRILFSACAECEVALKMLAARDGTATERYDINELKATVTAQYPEFTQEKVYMRRFGLDFDPWENWRAGTNPDWWRAYNSVKHHRVLNYPEGNLRNALDAVAALMVAVVVYYRYEMSPPGQPMDYREVFGKLSPDSRLFFFDDSRYMKRLVVRC